MLEVQNLEAVYHSVVRVLRGVSFSLPEGGVVALLGPNGAGKTTTLRAITGMLDLHEGEVTKGSITLNGRSILGMASNELVQLGICQVLEGRRVFAELTVEENLRAGAVAVGGATKEGLNEAYGRFPVLGERRKQPAGYLSGGEQQMLAIARALMAKPKVLLLDEPSLGLAPKVVDQVSNLIREINADGVSILLVEQNASVALSLADTATILETGRVVAAGTADELKADKDIQEFYLGLGASGRKSYREVKHYRRRKRWLS